VTLIFVSCYKHAPSLNVYDEMSSLFDAYDYYLRENELYNELDKQLNTALSHLSPQTRGIAPLGIKLCCCSLNSHEKDNKTNESLRLHVGYKFLDMQPTQNMNYFFQEAGDEMTVK